jgi:formylglycine-generating enzyme required for sulfatase activity
LEKAYTINGEEVECNFDSNGYRLPTEWEWEFAAKANQDFKYSGSDNVDEVAWTRENSNKQTHPVGQKKPNGFGLYDMSGNVFEWCWDCYTEGSSRVYRGGSWERGAWYACVSCRLWYDRLG